MSESKKICKSPNCKKEVYKEGALFCLQHERSLESGKNVVKKSALTMLGLGVAAVGKAFLDTNKKS